MKTIIGSFVTPNGAPAAYGTLALQLSQDALIFFNSQVAPVAYYVTLDATGPSRRAPRSSRTTN